MWKSNFQADSRPDCRYFNEASRTGQKIQLLAPIVRGRKGEHVKILKDAKKSGYVRVRIDGNLYDLAEEIS